jgi:hypothetical protein
MAARDARPAPAEAAARRVEEILERLADHTDPAVARTAEDLVGALTEFYGSGLARVVALLSARGGSPLAAPLDDPLAAGLLALHGLHPDGLPRRVQRALRAADAGRAEVTVLDAGSGRLRLRLESGSGSDGRGPGTARARIGEALARFAPEIESVEYEDEVEVEHGDADGDEADYADGGGDGGEEPEAGGRGPARPRTGVGPSATHPVDAR